jgi:hypothetical protein
MLDVYYNSKIKKILSVSLAMFLITGSLALVIPESIPIAYATSVIISDQISCESSPIFGTWNGINTCTVSSLVINSEDSITITSGIKLLNNGNITNYGTINITNNAILFNKLNGIISNSGSISLLGTQLGSKFINYGTLINNHDGIISNSCTFNNFGIITNSGTISNSGVINNSGTINNQCGSIYSGTLPTGNPINIIACYTISFNQQAYDLGSNAIITITDSSANTNSSTIDTLSASVSSSSDLGFTMTATETGINTGVFSVTILLSDSATTPSLNVLHVDSGQSISATYNTQTTTADVVPPGASGIDAGAANVIRFDSDVYYLNTAGIIKSSNLPTSVCNTNTAGYNTLYANITSSVGALTNVLLNETATNSCQFISKYAVKFSDQSTIAAGPTQQIKVLPNTLIGLKLVGTQYAGNTLIVPTPSSVILAGTQLPAVGLTCAFDTDVDGICDDWETATGLTIPLGMATYQYDDSGLCPRLIDDRTNPYVDDTNNPRTCPSPTKKDVFVEIDYMINHRPSNAALLSVVNAFKSAPTTQIAGVTPGINLHILLDEQLPFHDVTIPMDAAVGSTGAPHGGFLQLKQNYFGTTLEHTATAQIPQEYLNDLLDAKAQVFHYSMWIHSLSATPKSSGYGEVWGNDSIVSLGAFADGEGTVDQQAATFMHELGHNLKLNHGGSGTAATGYQNCKSNYLSLMNYAFQFKQGEGGYVVNRPIDFSRKNQLVLVESNLSELVGINASNPTGLTTVYGPQSGLPTLGILTKILSTTNNPINWNRDADTTDTGISVDVNDFDILGCNDDDVPTIVESPYKEHGNLIGYNDWTGMDLKFRSSASYADGTVQQDPANPILPQSNAEITTSTAETIKASVIGHTPPVITDTGSPYSANENEPITFTATATDAELGDSVTILWSLDDDDNYNDVNGSTKSFAQAGTYTVLVNATDIFGLSDVSLVEVIINDITEPWTITGYYPPVKMNNIVNVVKSGQTIPLKFEVFDGSVEKTSTSDIASFTQDSINCNTLASTGAEPIKITINGQTSLKYNGQLGQFIANWKTPNQTNTCWAVKVTTTDGPSITAYFKLK